MIVLTERYADKIPGVLSCFDRVVITGTLPEICHAQAMGRHFKTGYHWSLMQVEYATDIVFGGIKDLRPLYEELVRTAIQPLGR